MPLEPRFCAKCSAALETRLIEDRPRRVCTACGTIFYSNPLPVAAAVVLNERREVLLVRRAREPHQGMWCLPIGFAEVGESIAEAAMRELAEEAGVRGRVVRLVDVDSTKSDFYGDLLVVTFEAQVVAGEPRPGDDASDVGWFALDRLPELAFESNYKALAYCSQAHSDEWAIRASFDSLAADADAVLLSEPLVEFIRDNAALVAGRWLEEVCSNPTTARYCDADSGYLYHQASKALTQFSRWLKGDEADAEVRAFYRALGQRHRQWGFDPSEMISSLTLLRKHIWTFARSQGMLHKTIDVYRVLELDRRLVLFFDKALHALVKGYWEAEPADRSAST